MNELLKKLLAAEVLTEETKAELETAFATQLQEALDKAKADATATVTTELNEAWITERETLIEAIDAQVSGILVEELSELKKDIDTFRDLEAEYAERIVEAKSEMSTTLKSDLAQLVEKLDSFLEIRLASELGEFRESIEQAKKNEFGKKVFESFVSEFKKHYAGDDSVEAKLNETELKLNETLKTLAEAEQTAARLDRSIKLEKVLAPLSGRTKEVMEAILKNVDTPLLENAYTTYIGRVLKDTSTKDVTSDQESKVLAEGVKVITGVVKTGDNEQLLEDQRSTKTTPASTLNESERQRNRRLAGLV